MNDTNNSLNNDVVNALVADRKRDRLWKNIRFFVWIFIILLFIIALFAPTSKRFNSSSTTNKPYVALIRLNGAIMPNSNFSARKVIPLLNRAFADKRAKGVVLVINSPGGSAVQASIIHDKIEQLKKKYHKKVVVVGQDVLASGAYLIATAADKIYVHRDTLTGSIGVIMDGFGFTGTIQKLGITRRVFTAGQNKDRLDPFKPLTPGDITKVHNVLNAAHQNFINDVLQGRKGKLNGNKNELFSGDFWIGQKAVQLGLADGTGNLWTVLKQQFNVTHYKNFSIRPSLIQTLMHGVDSALHLPSLGLRGNNDAIMAIAPGV